MATLLFIQVILLGLCLGSFVALATVRLPKGESIVFPRSHCSHCATQLRWWENIPVLSYILVRGKCTHCRASIAMLYPAIEIAVTLLVLWGYLRIEPLPRFLLYAAFFITPMAILLITDWKHLILPNQITLSGIVFGFGLHFVDVWYFDFQFSYSSTVYTSFQALNIILESLTGLLFAAVPFLVIALVYEKLRHKEGLGMGDVKLIAMIGAVFGVQGVPVIVLLAAFSAILFQLSRMLFGRSSAQSPIPFGSFLAGSSLCYLFYSEQIWQYMVRIIL